MRSPDSARTSAASAKWVAPRRGDDPDLYYRDAVELQLLLEALGGGSGPTRVETIFFKIEGQEC